MRDTPPLSNEQLSRAWELVDLSATIFVAIQADQTIELVNARACEVLGRPREEIIGTNWFDTFLPAELREDVRAYFVSIIEEGAEIPPVYENPVLTGSGERRIVEWRTRLVQDGHGRVTGVISSGEDVTERVRALEEEERRRDVEEQLRHAQKLESLGILAGGVAHDFANILLSVIGFTALSLEDLPSGSPIRYNLEQVETAAKRATDLCKQMLAFSGKGRFITEGVDLNALVGEIGQMLKVSISKKVALQEDLDPALPAIEGDPGHLTQILLNLIANASDAFEDRPGVISLRTGVVACTPAALRETYVDDNLPGGRYVFLEVSDSGTGMDPETLARIFDPFFTTKFTGRGLGLAAVLGIVRSHHGAIDVRSEPGRGTTVRVLFPEAPEALILAADAASVQGTARQSAGLVLVVDDEEAIREIGYRVLTRAGCEVVVAADGREALARAGELGDAIDCVVLDLTMPEMDGKETFRALRRERVDLPVILSSGYSEAAVSGWLEGEAYTEFLSKPYSPDELNAAVRSVMRKD